MANEFSFDGTQRIDVSVSEQGIESCVRGVEQIAAAFQQIDPDVAMSLRGEALRLGEHLESVVKGAAVVALQTAVISTPLDTGLARGNWRVKINKTRPGSAPTEDTDPTGLETIAKGTFIINNTKRQPGQVIWISNSAHHISALEAGWSKQAPAGMTLLAKSAAEAYVTRRRLEKRGRL